MKRGYKILLCSLVAALPLLMAPTGGFPSRPAFQSVTVIGDGTQNVNLAPAPSTGNAGMNLVTVGGTAVIGAPGTAGSIVVDSAAGDLVLRTSARAIRFTVDGGSTTAAQVTSGGVLQLNGSTPVAGVISARKAAPTSRTSTIVSAADPDLTFTLPAGSWILTGFLLFDNVTTTTQGARYQLNFAGTFDPALVVRCIDSRTSLLAAATVGVQAMNSDTTIADVSTANLDIAEIRCYMRATVAGVVQIRWAQEASSANATRLNNGSWLTAERVGA